MKLFHTKEAREDVSDIKVIKPITQTPSVEHLDKDFSALDTHVTAYCSMNIVHNQIASESFNMIDKSNYVLYNEYITAISKNLDIPKPVLISQEAIQTLPGVVVNHHVSLEGLLGDLWGKIKAFFSGIYDKIKQFFVTYFTRLGRLKNKLKNILEVLAETDKDLTTVNLDNPPSAIASKYPYEKRISYGGVTEVFNNIAIAGTILTKVNDKARSLASKEILDKNFVGKVKALRDQAKAAGDQIGKNKEEINKPKGMFFTDERAKNKEKAKGLKEDNRNLEDLRRDSEKEANQTEEEMRDINSNNKPSELEIDDKGFQEAKKEFDLLMSEIDKEFKQLINKPLVNGVTITKVEVNEDSGIELEKDTNKDKPDGVALASKTEVITLISKTSKVVESVEKVSKNYGEINETIMNNVNAVDKIIMDLEKTPDKEYGKYKTILSKKVKERLNLMKTFFGTYNKINRSLFEMVLDAADGNVAYAVLCMKYYGK